MFVLVIIIVLIVFIVAISGKPSQNSYQESGVSHRKNAGKTSRIPGVNENYKWEIVRRGTARWIELGFASFPGYGRLYDREFRVWYCDVGSKEIKNEQQHYDRFPLHYNPKNSEKITGNDVYINRLDVTRGYIALFTGLDNKNRRRWYFALVKCTPTWIEAERALVSESDAEKETIEIIRPEIIVPDGWEWVRNGSNRWAELDYNNGFPGYGKIQEITFDVWYIIDGSKERVSMPPVIVQLALYGKDENIYYVDRIFNKIDDLNKRKISLNRLSNTQGYLHLYTAIDYKNKRKWYIGATQIKPTFIFTSSEA